MPKPPAYATPGGYVLCGKDCSRGQAEHDDAVAPHKGGRGDETYARRPTSRGNECETWTPRTER